MSALRRWLEALYERMLDALGWVGERLPDLDDDDWDEP